MYAVNRKVLGVLIALVALGAMAFSAAPASAEACTENILCSGAGEKLRDDFDGAPAAKGYGGDLLATNTAGTLRLLSLNSSGAPVAKNQNPANYAYFGLEVLSNPETSSEVCRDAEGWVTFADIQNAEPSPIYAGISPTRFGPWPFVVMSDSEACGEQAGRVTIEDVHLFLSNVGGGATATAVGTFTGTYSQPGEGQCEAGGVELDLLQPGVTVSIPALGQTLSGGVDNGNEEPAFICFVSSNNALYPTEAPTWGPFTDDAESAEAGIWKD